jgi:hypothetical protein
MIDMTEGAFRLKFDSDGLSIFQSIGDPPVQVQIFSVGNGGVDIKDPANPSTNLISLKPAEQSLFEMGLVAGQRFSVDKFGQVERIVYASLTEEQKAAQPYLTGYAHEGNCFFVNGNGQHINITG